MAFAKNRNEFTNGLNLMGLPKNKNIVYPELTIPDFKDQTSFRLHLQTMKTTLNTINYYSTSVDNILGVGFKRYYINNC